MTEAQNFREFIKKQGVVGLAVGFLLGGAVSKVVTALITDIVNPLLSVFLGTTEGLKEAKLKIGEIEILWGDFLSVTIDFLIIAFVVYLLIKFLGLEVGKK